jgi:glycerol-3-phosphate O-acyltransferase
MAFVPQRDRQTTGSGTELLVLAEARTRTERDLLARWAAEHRPQGRLLELDSPELAGHLADRDDLLVEPVRVTWLPAEGSNLAQLLDPRRPNGRLQALIARRSPDRVRITPGEAARAAALRERFVAQEGGGSAGAFAAFVGRQARIACDRAERQVIGDRYKVPRLVAEQIAASASFREEVAQIAEAEDRDPEEAMAAAVACLNELVAVQSPPAIDAFRAFTRPMHERAWTVDADRAGLERLRELNKKAALVFLPTHRSYVDPLVLAEVLHDADFPRNHLLGGDNMAFWPMGTLGRRAGVIFIRRNFGKDRLYRLAIRAYFGHLVAKRFNVEWYIEGGRTRTGKLRPPRYGLLHYLVRAVEDRGTDVLLVPTSIVYERLHEVSAMAAEQRGAKKRGEGLRWMADYVKAQSQNVGTAKVDFGEPLSLRAALEEAGEGPAQLEKVAFRICEGINRITPVTPPSLVSLVLLGLRDRALTLDQVQTLTAPLVDLLEEREVPGDLPALRRRGTLTRALEQLVGTGCVERFDGGDEPVWTVAADGHPVAAFYRNGALHHLLLRAIGELCLVRLADAEEDEDLLEVSRDDALALRDLLKFEFFFPAKREFLDALAREMALMDPDWPARCAQPAGAAGLLAGCRTLVAHRTLRSFFDAQLVVATLLVRRSPREAVDQETFLAEALGIGRQMVLQGRVHGAESVSRELFDAALKLAANRDLVDPGRDEVRRARETYLSEVEEVLDRLRQVEALDRIALQEVLHDDDR